MKVITWKKADNCYEAWKERDGDNLLLGNLSLQQCGRHKHWAWEQEQFIIMFPGCMDEVREKQKELFKDRKPH